MDLPEVWLIMICILRSASVLVLAGRLHESCVTIPMQRIHSGQSDGVYVGDEFQLGPFFRITVCVCYILIHL
ncbi:hypothetical protein EV421DRAFT_98975 [Armillaria borealis]|uniref:Secreted protein n=1 Tax=Armillaria borealis TaxID=47425 RepID=A0AA39KBD8_9AGAR|nr:hypothetical protein EV421DRAFT_98975 [Armillaria borealis]